MAAVASPHAPMPAMRDDVVMDTRTPSPVHAVQTPPATSDNDSSYNPDLSAEVAMLSTKLVNAINYQTNLDDSLQQTRHELEQAKKKVAQLEEENHRHKALVSSGVLVRQADMQKIIAGLRKELSAERIARAEAEKGKKQVEGELENLTTALFEEANTMVAAARKDTEAVEKRNAQLRGQLEEYEQLMAAQREQLTDLKGSMEKLESDQPGTREPSVPSTPVTTQHAMLEPLQLSSSLHSVADQSPEHPLHFSSLINPVLRNDTKAFEDFQDLLLLARRLGAHSRNNSNQTGAATNSTQLYSAHGSVSSSPNLPGAFSFGQTSPTTAYHNAAATIPPLKDSKFYKRVLTEDIEPTLRLDLAPGLSFLSRRTVLASLVTGTLNVEPYPQNKHYFACTLCGESKRQEQYVRRHRFLTSEEDNVSKPLCDFCTSRVRTTCDFVGFLRMVRDGHWKCDSEDDQKAAWEESVRLRERMFWARLGGGVVPCFASLPRSGLPSPISAHGSAPGSTRGSTSGRQSLDDIPEGADKDAPQCENDVFQERPTPSVRVSTSAITDANDEKKEIEQNAIEENDFARQASLDPQAQDGAEKELPPTPFEDAKEEIAKADDAVAEPTEVVSEATKQTPESSEVPEKPTEEATKPASDPARPTTPTNVPDSQLEEDSHKQDSKIRTSTGSLQASVQLSPTRKSLDVAQRGSPERKVSSVLARVKAMEASSQ
ncbi:hypothetical protein CKM354_000135700 [Cercospora kikuchii]|uniref:GDP/GTP exchange factor Sec2 N-terminal domain-containing protein n=1 Tax=Cercospora kikuchii TaxID=84275 RepID=A0A9P3C7V8_9PEZI|nr:uncharacterized protein CKM354_000135700 [Cercospora kikuchii]GIZ37928.1 hypothetical protein CKM354_000135700 [Cercospora kikuchii]